MFENVLYQNATDLLRDDIKRNNLPGSILLSGPEASAKLTAALEIARVLSCETDGNWNCTCPSCLKNKALVSENLLIAGPCDRTLEIKAAASTLLTQNVNNTSHLEASRYLFIRAVRKLTLRFSPILWEGEDKQSKFSPLLQNINENLEILEPGRVIPDDEELGKIVKDIIDDCSKLEKTYLYDHLPVNQIRNFSSWAHLSTVHGKKVLVLENADRMADGARNALLKILEEPPENTMFILTTSNRGAMLPTILSRVRTYGFRQRSSNEQIEVIDRVYHYDAVNGTRAVKSIDSFLQTFLPVEPNTIRLYSSDFFAAIAQGKVPDIQKVVSGCNGFDPRLIFKVFITGLVDAQRGLAKSQAGCEASAKILDELRQCYNNVGVYNQNPASSLEMLSRNLLQINHLYNGILKDAISE